MKTMIRISWRNVWRNKGRSIVIILAVSFGLWGGIFASAFISGMINQMVDSGIKHQVSHIQIHHPDFVRERLTEYSIVNAQEIYNFLDISSEVTAYSYRTVANGMLATASMTSGIEIYGIDPEMEHQTTTFEETMIDGDYFESVKKNAVLIGARLADKMKIETGNRIVITFQDPHGDIVSSAFRVCGIYRTSNTMNDERNVYVHEKDLAQLIGHDGIVNEIAILLHDIEKVNFFRDELKTGFPDSEIRTWAEISPDLGMMKEFSGITMMILLIIILFAMAFGLLNTMLMTIFERTRELGVLMSVGMNKVRVFSMILLETIFLIFTGSAFGTILGIITISATAKTGINLTSVGGDTLSDFGIDPVIYPYIEPIFYVNLFILVLIMAILSSVYPAYRALKLKPAEAVRKE
jgi:putative ABC transport system permease protein